MFFFSYFLRNFFFFFCRNFLLSKYNIYNIFFLPKFSGFLILFNFFKGLAIWKRRFSTILILFLFIFYFLFERVAWTKFLKNIILYRKSINIVLKYIFMFISKTRFVFDLLSKLILSLFFRGTSLFFRSRVKPNIFKISLNFFFDLIICNYFIYFSFFFRRVFDSYSFLIFFIFDIRGIFMSYDILRLYTFKL